MINILLIGILYIFYKIARYIYRVYTCDISELLKYKDQRENIIFAVYGHTSSLDIPLILWIMMQMNFIGLAKKKYKWMYPNFCHKYLHFIEKNTSTMQFDKPPIIAIEGTRNRLPYIRTGFKYIAKNTNSKIIYLVIDFKTNKVHISKPIDNYTDDVLINHLNTFLTGA